MKKIINIKPKKSLAQHLIESSLKVGDKDYVKKLRKRVVDLTRARDLAKGALKRAEENGQADLAEKLRIRIEELDNLLATYNVDTLDSETGEKAGGEEDSNNANSADKSEQNDEEDSENSNDSEKSEDSDDSEDSDSNENDKTSEDNDSESHDAQDKNSSKNPSNSNNKNDASNSKNNKDEQNEDDSDEDNKDKSDSEDADNNSLDNLDDNDDESGKPKKNKNSDQEDPSEDNDNDKDGDDSNDSDNDERDENSSNKKSDKEKKKSEEDNNDSDAEADDASDNSENTKSDNKNKNSDSNKNNNVSNGEDDEEDSDSKSSDNKQSQNQDDDSQDQDSDNEKSKQQSKPSLDQNADSADGDDDSEFQNPFADDEDISSNGGLPTGGKPPREATTDETIELLKTLKGEGREGAKDALKELIAKRKGTATESFKPVGGQSLTEAVKSIRDMTDDEFGDYINDTYDLIDQADPVNYVDDIEDRKNKVSDWSQDPTVIQDLFGEDDLEIQKDYQKKKAREMAKAKYSNMAGLDDFKMDFYAAIHNQVETIKQEYQSYDEINAEYESEDVIMKADIEKELPAEAKPIIDVYFDVSGSWEDHHIKTGEAAIASVKVFEDQGDIVMNIFYFSDGISNVSMEHCRDTYGTGTTAWPLILQNIKATEAKNVLIMSDGDFERLNYHGYGPKNHGSLTVEGCVWYLWKDGEASPSALQKLKGRQGVFQYGFRA